MSRQLKRQISRAQGRRGGSASPARPWSPARPEVADAATERMRRMNRLLLIGGSLLAIGAVVVSLLAPHFDPVGLGMNLAGIALGLLMGKGIGKFMFRRILPNK